MAKQRGIHQIKGKINNLCYYEQKYVRGGLIRRINEAMSERLKTDPVFENTRSANSYFGAFSMLSKILLSFASYRGSTLMYPSRQAKLTSSLRRAYTSFSSDTYNASISLDEMPIDAMLSALNNLSKVKADLYFPVLYTNRLGEDLSRGFRLLIPEEYLIRYCRTFKVERIQFELLGVSGVDNIEYDTRSRKYITPYNSVARNISTYMWEIGDGELDNLFGITQSDRYLNFVYLTILPVVSGSGALAKFNTSGAIGLYIAV